jgi:hypothetical protein
MHELELHYNENFDVFLEKNNIQKTESQKTKKGGREKRITVVYFD